MFPMRVLLLFSLVFLFGPAAFSQQGVFEENRGQAPPEILYDLRHGYSLTANGFIISPDYVKATFLGANPSPTVQAREQAPGVAHFLHGHNPSQWVTGVRLFREVVYFGLYPGIDLRYEADPNYLKLVWTLAPGADPSRILFGFDAAPEILSNGRLVLRVAFRRTMGFSDAVPTAHEIGFPGGNKAVPSAWKLVGERQLGIEVGDFDRTKLLRIEVSFPRMLPYEERPYQVDNSGSIYYGGETPQLARIPGSGTGFDRIVSDGICGGLREQPFACQNASVFKYSSSGELLGDSKWDTRAEDLAVDSQNNLWVSTSRSKEFPDLPSGWVSCAQSAASLRGAETVAPGEIVAIFGAGLGPRQGESARLTAEGKLPRNLGGVRVLFDDRPAPLLYVQTGQINAVAPFDLNPNQPVTLTVEYEGKRLIHMLRVVSAQPGMFTSDGSGHGWVAALNQDGSVNSTTNPAQVGSIVSLFFTGTGPTAPPSEAGEIARTTDAVLQVPLSIFTIVEPGSIEPLPILYAGYSPGLLTSVTQVNLRLPQKAPLAVPHAPLQLPLLVQGGFGPVAIAVRE